MEGSRLPPTSTCTSTATATNNKDKPGDPSSTWHRPTNSLPHLPSSTSQVFSPPPHFRNHSLNLFPITSASPPPDPIPEIETYVVQVPKDQVNRTPPPENARIVERPPPHDPIPEIETYVVQVPKDQVYRSSPPPENARIVERHLNSEPDKKNKRFCSKRLKWFFIAVIIIGFIISAIALVIRFAFKPEPPIFDVKKLTKSRHFEIMLTSKNPSSHMWVTYKGLVSLNYKNTIVGQGNFPELSQPMHGFDFINLQLDESKNVADLPFEAISLVLTMDLSADYGTGLVKRSKEVAVTCDVKVKGLLDAMEADIVSENCESGFAK